METIFKKSLTLITALLFVLTIHAQEDHKVLVFKKKKNNREFYIPLHGYSNLVTIKLKNNRKMYCRINGYADSVFTIGEKLKKLNSPETNAAIRAIIEDKSLSKAEKREKKLQVNFGNELTLKTSEIKKISTTRWGMKKHRPWIIGSEVIAAGVASWGIYEFIINEGGRRTGVLSDRLYMATGAAVVSCLLLYVTSHQNLNLQEKWDVKGIEVVKDKK